LFCSALGLFEFARVLVRFDHVASFIMPERVLVLIDYIRLIFWAARRQDVSYAQRKQPA
jgi:hypothetical protein